MDAERKDLATALLNAIAGQHSGTRPIPEALAQAMELINLLPEDISIPEFAIEDDGSIAFEWLASQKQMISMSVNGTEQIAFAFLHGGLHGHDVAHFGPNGIPEVIVEHIRSL